MIYVFICSMIDLGQMKQTHWVCFQKQRPTSALLTVFLFGILEFPRMKLLASGNDTRNPRLTTPQETNMSPKKEPFQQESNLPTSML